MKNIFNSLITDFNTTGDLEKDSQTLLIKYNRFRIAEHSLRVAAKARTLARRFGIDGHLAVTAGLLHDIGGIYPNNERLEISKALELDIFREEEALPLILHQKISSVMAREIFDIKSDEVLTAIGCHSTLKAGASPLDMIIFVADKIEWDQNGLPPYVDQLEKALHVSLECGAYTYIKYQLDNKSNLKVVHPWLLEAYEDLKKRII